jgi:hypothetical protein
VERKKNDAKKLSCEKLPQRLCYMSTMVEFVAWWASIAQRTPAWLVKANTHHHRGQSERACWQQQSVTTPKYTLMNHAYSFLNSTNKTLCDEEYASSIGYSHIMVCFVMRESHPADQPSRTCAWMHTVWKQSYSFKLHQFSLVPINTQ